MKLWRLLNSQVLLSDLRHKTQSNKPLWSRQKRVCMYIKYTRRYVCCGRHSYLKAQQI